MSTIQYTNSFSASVLGLVKTTRGRRGHHLGGRGRGEPYKDY